MAECNLKKGDRIYECRYHEVTLVELVTDPEMLVQGSDSHYWHWKAKVIETNSGNVVSGEIVEYGISEESPQYGPKLFRKNMYEVGYENAEPILPPFDRDSNKEIEIKRYFITDDVEILEHVFHGLQDIKEHVEMSLYRDYSRGKANERDPKKTCEIHVGEMWMPYPCFDSEDFANEDRNYQNFVFRRRPIIQEDMRKLSELPSGSNECRIHKNMPSDMLPMVYYVGDGNIMIVAM